MVQRKLVGYARDEVYIGSAEERAANALKEDSVVSADSNYDVKPGHLYPGVPTLPPNFGDRTKTIEEINELESELLEHLRETEKRIKDLQLKKEKLVNASTTKQAEP